MIKYSNEEFKKIKQWFPNLNYYENTKKIIGKIIISFCRYQKKEEGVRLSKWEIAKCDTSCIDYIKNNFLIQIDFNQMDFQGYPKVYEISEKIENLAKALGKSIIDLHLYPKDKSCCLGINIEPSTTLSDFILYDVYPYFVWQAYYSQYKKIPPCGEYSHGVKGVMEAVQDYKETMTSVNKIRVNETCPCKSGKKYKNCCLEKDKRKRHNLCIAKTRLHRMEKYEKSHIKEDKNMIKK